MICPREIRLALRQRPAAAGQGRLSRPMASSRLVSIAVAACLSLAAQQPGARENPLAGTPGAVDAGRVLFLEKCSACHGPHGEGGRGPSLISGRETRRATDGQLFDSIKNGVRGADMPGFPLPGDELWRLVAFVRSLSAPAIETVVPGDPAAGADIYWGTGACSRCHMIRGKGGVTGPDLTNIGRMLRADQLREALLEPSARISEGFRAVEARTRRGLTIKGAAKLENNYSLRLFDAGGKLHFLQKRDLVEVRYAAKSLMPGDYAERLSEQQLRDLLAFLSRQSLREPVKQ